MIPTWLKHLVLLALILFAVVDAGSPLVVRLQLDSTARSAAAAGGRTYLRNDHDIAQAEAAARAEVEGAGAALEHFEVLPDGRINLTVSREADSRLFERISQLDGWYHVEVEATSTGRAL